MGRARRPRWPAPCATHGGSGRILTFGRLLGWLETRQISPFFYFSMSLYFCRGCPLFLQRGGGFFPAPRPHGSQIDGSPRRRNLFRFFTGAPAPHRTRGTRATTDGLPLVG